MSINRHGLQALAPARSPPYVPRMAKWVQHLLFLAFILAVLALWPEIDVGGADITG